MIFEERLYLLAITKKMWRVGGRITIHMSSLRLYRRLTDYLDSPSPTFVIDTFIQK